MSERHFHLRQSADYSGTDNSVTGLQVELMVKGKWEPFEASNQTAGFLLFTYTLLTCQHMYMRVNAAEKQLLLNSSEGDIFVVTSEDWNLQSVKVHFTANLRSGSASAEDIDYITGRMKVCPVSKNIISKPEKLTTLSFT